MARLDGSDIGMQTPPPTGRGGNGKLREDKADRPRSLADIDPMRLRNKWVRLEPFSPDYLDLVDQSGAADYMWKWMPALPERGTSFASYTQYVLGETERGAMIPLTLWSPDCGRFIGGAAFIEPNRIHRSVRIGFTWVSPDVRGTPVFLASQSLMIRHAQAWGVKRIEWRGDTRNASNIRALERMGAVCEGVLRSACKMANGDWADVAIYAMVGADIEAGVQKIDGILAALD